MNKKKSENKQIIKGTFFSFHKALFHIPFCSCISLYLTGQLIFKEMDAPEIEKTVWALLGFLVITAFFYWSTTADYYYYEFDEHKMTVKNFLKKYHKEFYYDKIINTNIYGSLEMTAFYFNSIEIFHSENQSSKKYKYRSANLKKEDWIGLIKKLQTLNIPVGDPHKKFQLVINQA